jgi:hypothetical protein
MRKGIPHNHADLPPRVSIEIIGVCIPIGNSDVLLQAVSKSPSHAWNDAGIIEFLSIRHNLLLVRYLNTNHPFENSIVSNISGATLVNLLHINEFEISAPQCPTDYLPAENGDIFDTVLHKNIRLSEVTVSDRSPTNHFPLAESC